MFRAKVGFSLFLVFAVAAAALFVHVGGTIDASTDLAIGQRLKVAQKAIERSRRLNDFWVLARARQVAAWPQMGEVLATPPEAFADEAGTPPDAETFRYNIHRKMNEELSVWQAKYRALAEHQAKPTAALHDWRSEVPDWFVVVNMNGIGTAKADDAAWYGPDEANVLKQHPVIQGALDGHALVDVWLIKGAPMTVAVAPVRHGGKVVGATLIGYRLTSGEARRDKANVGTDVAYFLGTTLSQSSSLRSSGERAVRQALAAQELYQKPSKELVELQVQGQTLAGLVSVLSGYAGAKDAGFVVLVDAGQMRTNARAVLMAIPLVAGLAFLLAFASVLAAFQMFVKPFEEMDRGLLEIINGDLDYWFDAGKKELSGTMSQNLNIMVCNLSGRPLPEDEE
jgi:hypothetical protein